MPYVRVGKCVFNQNADGSQGSLHGCSDTIEEAEAYMRALYAHENDASKKQMSDWGLTDEAADAKGTLRTLFTGKVHDAFTCVTDQLTMRGYLSQAQNKTLTDIKGAMLKLFNEQVPQDIADIAVSPEVLDAIASYKEILNQPSYFVTSKEFDAPFHWIMFTSSAFQDRDGETVSLKAHQADIARMEQEHNFGTLDWWHLHPLNFALIESPDDVRELPPVVQKQGVILGDCTLSGMHGRIRVEAGTYRSKQIQEAMNRNADNLSASLLFLRPKNEPDSSGTFHNIRTVSRAIMPRAKVSNYAPFLMPLIPN